MASFGVTTALVSIVLSIFMAGLGLGSWVAGVIFRKRSSTIARRALRFYALTELLIGCSALLVPIELKFGRELMLHMHYLGSWQSWSYYVVTGLWLAVTLLPGCTLLGSTYPFLMAAIREVYPSTYGRSFSYLYLANVLGALLGTLVSAFFLIELLGFERALWAAASLNLMLALLAFRMSFGLSGSVEAETRGERPGTQISLYGLRRSAILLMLFVTGLVSMGSEVVWMRQFTPYLGNFVYAFAVILGLYLLATALGARDYRNWTRSHQPGDSASAWSWLAVSALIPVVGANPLLHLARGEMNGLRILSIALFCCLTGFLTPLLVDTWSRGEPDRAGLAYAFNILGCIVGPVIASFGLVSWLGERWSILVLSLPLFGIAGVIAFGSRADSQGYRRPKVSFIAAVAVGLLLVCFSDDFETQFRVREVKRDYAATVIATGTGFGRTLMVNGAGMTALTPHTKYMVHLPLAFMDRAPRNGLVICFGMGTSFRSMLSWGIPTTAVDLIPSVPKLFPYYHADAQELLHSPLAEVVVDDGRRFLDGSNRTYDVIVVDPPPPVEAPGSSLLYSREFYEVIKRHLNHDGVLQIWYPSLLGDRATTASMTKALIQSFPYVRAYHSFDGQYGIHYLAGLEPIGTLDGRTLTSRMPAAAKSDFVEWGPSANVEEQFDLVLSREIPLQQLVQEDSGIPVLSDDRPVNEYFLLRRSFASRR